MRCIHMISRTVFRVRITVVLGDTEVVIDLDIH